MSQSYWNFDTCLWSQTESILAEVISLRFNTFIPEHPVYAVKTQEILKSVTNSHDFDKKKDENMYGFLKQKILANLKRFNSLTNCKDF